jgi:purine-binding chemotaxis protein CheW
MADERHGVPISAVEQIFARPILTPAPGVGPRWAGVLAVQGEIVPILHLARILDLPEAKPDSVKYVLSLRAAGRKLGLLVGRVLEIRDIPMQGLRPAGSQARYLKGISPDDELILDIDLLVEQEFSQ